MSEFGAKTQALLDEAHARRWDWVYQVGRGELVTPRLDETYRAGQLPAGSVVRSGSTEYVVGASGLLMRWEQPIPGSESWTVTYVGRLPGHGQREPPGDAGRWMTPRERAEVDQTRPLTAAES